MPADLIHLVRHGEVHNPTGILYGRIEGFGLSERGHRMAEAAAASFDGHPISALYASPLQRTQESAAPWVQRFGLEITTDDRIIEPTNAFEGSTFNLRPASWKHLVNPYKPSWGEAFVSVKARMFEAITDAWQAVEGGEVVMVSHQMPIVMVQRSAASKKLHHDPRKRRCSLSSITTLRREGDRFVEVAYAEPAKHLLIGAIDSGAV